MSEGPHLLLRADGGTEIGIGHLMRCLALGQAWQDQGGSVVLLSASLPASLEARFAREGIEAIPLPCEPGGAEDARALAREAATRGACVALDGYRFGPAYQEAVAGAARRLLLVADHGRPAPGPVDLLLDQNLGSGPDRYPGLPPSCKALFGPRYALLRRELREAAATPANRHHPPRRLLLTLGGGDQTRVARLLLEALGRRPMGLSEIKVLVGPESQGGQDEEERWPTPSLVLSVVTDPPEVLPLFQWADAALSAAGSTAWELACLGVPTVLVAIATNQEPIARELEAEGAALSAGRAGSDVGESAVFQLGRLVQNVELVQRLRTRARHLVDGRGTRRVTRALLSLAESGSFA